MKTTATFNLSQTSYSLAQSQQLAALKYRQGRYQAQAPASADWLANLAQRSQQQADLLLSTLTLDGAAFTYLTALKYVQGLQLKHLNAQHIQQLHQQLHPKGGQWRELKLSLPLRHLSGQRISISSHSTPVTQGIDQQLHNLRGHIAAGIEPLVAIPIFIAEFLQLFPFLNGNRRIALLLLRQLLIEQGHSVLQYQALEPLVLKDDPQFYSQLYAYSQQQASPAEWLSYCWQVLQQGYENFQLAYQQANISNKRGGKTQLIKQTLASFDGPFSLTELGQQLPTIGPDMIRKVVRQCRQEGWLQATGRGRNAKWVVRTSHAL